MERPIVVFNHIPKTAGTTLRFILTQNYHPDEMLFVDNYDQLPAMREVLNDAERRRKLKLVYGHAAYAFAMEYKGPVQLVTFLRDPFERLVSHYHYSQRVVEDANHIYSSLGIEEFARRTLTDDYEARQMVFPMTRDLIPSTLDRRGMLFRTAMDNMRNLVSFVGIVERFDESVVLLRRHLKWPRLPIYAPLMVNDRIWKNEYSAEQRESICKLYLSVSQIVYDHAVKVHERSWKADEARNLSDLAELREQDRILADLLQQRELMWKQLQDARARKLAEGGSAVA